MYKLNAIGRTIAFFHRQNQCSFPLTIHLVILHFNESVAQEK